MRRALGTVIRELRKRAGLSQEEFGELAGLHRTYISMVERGIKSPTVVTLVDLTAALGMATAELMALFDQELATATGGGQRVSGDDVAVAADVSNTRPSAKAASFQG